MAARDFDDGRAFAQEWRQRVEAGFRDQAGINKTVTETLTELIASVQALKQSVDDLKKGPDTLRSSIGTYGSCLAYALGGVCTLLSLGTSIAALAVAILHR